MAKVTIGLTPGTPFTAYTYTFRASMIKLSVGRLRRKNECVRDFLLFVNDEHEGLAALPPSERAEAVEASAGRLVSGALALAKD